MHEMSIAQGILELVLEAGEANGARRVTAIKLLVGEMTGVELDTLTFCFDALAEGTAAEGAKLKAEMVPLMAACQSCTCQFRVEAYRFKCPNCGSVQVEIISGRELMVEQMEVD